MCPKSRTGRVLTAAGKIDATSADGRVIDEEMTIGIGETATMIGTERTIDIEGMATGGAEVMMREVGEDRTAVADAKQGRQSCTLLASCDAVLRINPYVVLLWYPDLPAGAGNADMRCIRGK